MNSYLYIWNPNDWAWVDYPDAVNWISNGDPYDMYWSCGNTKKIAVGDKFFLMKLGENVRTKGIIGCGYISSVPYEHPHWDAEKRAKGEVALRTDLLFKALSDQPIISLEELKNNFSDYTKNQEHQKYNNWTPQRSGISIPEEIAAKLFHELQNSKAFGFSSIDPKEVKLYAEGRDKTITLKTYDRSQKARQACIDYFGYNCTVCGFNFESKYGKIGRTFIEVHHLKPISEFNEEHLIDPIEGLRPVCANCHRMLHSSQQVLSIEELKALMR
ncbi:HNH endonuclease [Acinetobacter sp. ANC 4641]|uniref:HNH endonuclease n=1 Tax=Acinetobacter sp. ANC 4641 TaxID=2529847 RepID=UPI00103871A8|nr:HNH endonuclease [Acinetobacter sp. ANC 4641]TCB07459.1 HNH endonuclease [Acinetobacter sp. ANC 4641]